MRTPISLFAAMHKAVLDATLSDGTTMQHQVQEKPKRIVPLLKKDDSLPRHRHWQGEWEDRNEKKYFE